MPLDLTPEKAGRMIHHLEERIQALEARERSILEGFQANLAKVMAGLFRLHEEIEAVRESITKPSAN